MELCLVFVGLNTSAGRLGLSCPAAEEVTNIFTFSLTNDGLRKV